MAKWDITTTDTDALKRMDPSNEGHWTIVRPSFLDSSALTFEVAPPFQDYQYRFLVFRDPNKSGKWQLSPVYPDVDDERGHRPHMISTSIKGTRIPVICGPGGDPHPSLQSARGAAVKWTLYTSARLDGRDPGFSL